MELTYKEVYPMNPIEARKRIVHLYQQTQNDCETARRCHTFPQRVRKWVQRYQQDGEQGLHDLLKTPKRQPRKTDPDTEQRVLQLHQKTHDGRQRLARHLAQQGIHLSPHTIRHILRRHAPATRRPREPRRRFYPVWVGCMITTTRVGIRGMGWRVGRRMNVVWRWGLGVRRMWG
jgi:transposase